MLLNMIILCSDRCRNWNLKKKNLEKPCRKSRRKNGAEIWSATRKRENVCISCRSWKMLRNENPRAKIGFDTAENEPRHACSTIKAREPWCGIVSLPAANCVGSSNEKPEVNNDVSKRSQMRSFTVLSDLSAEAFFLSSVMIEWFGFTSAGSRHETKLPWLGLNFKFWRARSRFYRRRCLQVNVRWKALDEIYARLHRSRLKNC